MVKNSTLIISVITLLVTASCNRTGQPRPRGYFRIDLPAKEYQTYNQSCPYSFEFPVYATISPSDEKDAEPCWINISFPQYRSKIHISYKKIEGNLPRLLEDTYTLTYNHTIKADAIAETPFANPVDKVYGVLYDLKGNTATAVQFYLTDSVNHFIRGSLYFSAAPNSDSLAPVMKFFRDDIVRLMETTRWKPVN